MDKPAIRQALIAKRQAISDREAKEQAIRRRLAPFVKGKTVAAYHAVRQEADIYEPGWLLPKTIRQDHQMRFGTGETAPGPFGIPEPQSGYVDPETIDVVLVPMVGFCGTARLGYGGGYYDRFLPKTGALRIGIAFDEQEAVFDPAPWDAPMDMVITPTRIIGGVYNEKKK